MLSKLYKLWTSKLTKGDTVKMAKDKADLFVVGAELEMLFRLDQTDPNSAYLQPDSMQSIRFMKSFLVSNKFDIDSNHLYKGWNVHNDGSISPKLGFLPIELVSPALPYRKYKSEINRLWDILQNLPQGGPETNLTTGYHHGLSFLDADQQKLFKKRYMLFAWLWSKYEDAELIKWQRKSNRYCQPLSEACNWASSHTVGAYISQEISDPNYMAYNCHKYRSINTSKLMCENPYIELRYIGGEGYHQKTKQVLESLDLVMSLMYDTLYSKAAVTEFKKHLTYLTVNPVRSNKLLELMGE